MTTHKSTPILGLNANHDQIECVLYHAGRLQSLVIENSMQGLTNLGRWMSKHGIYHVHAICDGGSPYSQHVASFLERTGHRISMLDDNQIRACNDALACMSA